MKGSKHNILKIISKIFYIYWFFFILFLFCFDN